ncbi:MAG: hypothetical protein IJW18_01050 [Lachnospiraceae bacterium]|nr:hypothetical protein [Lachnospiraceae bacterium]
MKFIIDFFTKEKYQRKYLVLLKELQEYKNKSISLVLEGSLSSPKDIANACMVMEEGCYMRDYISNEGGTIVAIHFNRVRG